MVPEGALLALESNCATLAVWIGNLLFLDAAILEWVLSWLGVLLWLVSLELCLEVESTTTAEIIKVIIVHWSDLNFFFFARLNEDPIDHVEVGRQVLD